MHKAKYRIEMVELGAPTDQDRLRLKAEESFHQAVADDQTASPESLKRAEEYAAANGLWHLLNEPIEEALGLHRIAFQLAASGDNEKAISYYEQALVLRTNIGDVPGQAASLNNLRASYLALGKGDKAIEFYNRALPLVRTAHDLGMERITLRNLSGIYSDRHDKRALDCLNELVAIARETGDRKSEFSDLHSIGIYYATENEPQPALDYYNRRSMQAAVRATKPVKQPASSLWAPYMTICTTTTTRSGMTMTHWSAIAPLAAGAEAKTLTNIGIVYERAGDGRKAIDSYNQTLPIYLELGDKHREAEILAGIGYEYHRINEKENALPASTAARAVYWRIGDASGEDKMLIWVATETYALGQKERPLTPTGSLQLSVMTTMTARVKHRRWKIWRAIRMSCGSNRRRSKLTNARSRSAEIAAQTRLLHGVDLVTLSACNTAFTNRTEDGREIDSFGTIAQRLGARGVIASLWSVNDNSTAVLMQTMYWLRQQNAAVTKDEALRQAQLQLLSGDSVAGKTDANRGVTLVDAPSTSNATTNWSHLYYWAPFILIGNWK